jgi:NDP-sugar pyrophosphorylase family protein
LGLGFRHEPIVRWLRAYQAVGGCARTICVVEPAPLGTAAAIQLALPYLQSDPVLVLNGDTLIDVDLGDALAVYRTLQDHAALSIYAGGVSEPRRFAGAAFIARRALGTIAPECGVAYWCRGFTDIGTPEGLAAANR